LGGVLRGVDQRHNDAVRAEIECLHDRGRVVPWHADDRHGVGLRDRLEHRPDVTHVRRPVLHVDAEGIEALPRHHLRREPMGNREPAERDVPSVAPHLLDLVRSHCHTSSRGWPGYFGAAAGGATETPLTAFLEIASATRPETFTSSTKERRYFAAASRLFGVPIACWTAVNWPSSSRAPGSFATSIRSLGLSPASASIFWPTNRSNEASMPWVRINWACLMFRLSHSSYALLSDTAMRMPSRSTSAMERIGDPAGTR